MLGIAICLSSASVGQKSVKEEVASDSTKASKVRFTPYPVVAYQPETRLVLGAIGFLLFQPFSVIESSDSSFSRPSSLAPVLIYTTNSQLIITPRLNIYYQEHYQLNLKPTFRIYPNQFFGVGNDTRGSDLELFTENKFSVESQLYRIVEQRLFFGVELRLENNRLSQFDSEGRLEEGSFDGVDGGFNLGLGPAFQYDSRNDIIYPVKGRLIQFSFLVYPNMELNDYHYRTLSADLRKYVQLSEKNALAFRFRSVLSSNDVIPFYQYPKIGGAQRLRGLHANRFIDRNIYMLQTEWRRKLFKRWGMNVMAGLGDVAHRRSDFRLDEMKFSMSGGVRFRLLKKDPLNLAVDYGIGSRGQTGFYLSIGETF